MEHFRRHETRCKASKVSLEGEDVISSMPENVITDIMDRLPLQDAVRTSILSRSWRFNWTLLTQLVFDHYFLNDLTDREKHFDKTSITRLIFLLKGALTKFVLHIRDYMNLDVEDIDYWLMFLSRKGGLKELTIINWRETRVKLPTHLFSCLELKYLKLHNCVLSPPPYENLLSLDLWKVRFQDRKCGELIAQCPLLETLEILSVKPRGEVKLVEISKLENVKIFSLPLCLLDNTIMLRVSSVFQHISLFTKLQGVSYVLESASFWQKMLLKIRSPPVFLSSRLLHYTRWILVVIPCYHGFLGCFLAAQICKPFISQLYTRMMPHYLL